MSSCTNINVFFFGDSICTGQGVSIHSGWVARASEKLAEVSQQLGRDVVVNNASINGCTTRQALERMPYDIQSHRVDILIVQFGLNDCNYWETDHGVPRVSPLAFEANLHEIISRAYSSGVSKVLLNTNHVTGRDQELLPHTQITFQESNARYNQVIREVSRKEGPRVILNDVESSCRLYTQGDRTCLLSLLQNDLLHLSLHGHEFYFDILYPVIRQAVNDVIKGAKEF